MAEEATSPLRRVTFSYSRIQGASFVGERWASTDSICRTPDNPTGVRPGQNIEDAERAPLEHLLFGAQAEMKPKSQRAKDRARAKKAARPAESEPEYVYDPITNRKVPRPPVEEALSGPDETATPNTTFKSYRSQFSSLHPPAVNGEQAPIFYDGPPPPSELEKYSKVKIDPHPWETNSMPNGTVNVLGSTSSTTSVPDIVNALENMQKEAMGYESDVVMPESGLSPTGLDISAAVETAPPRKAKGCDDLHSKGSEAFEVEKERVQYTPFRSHEPDGKYNAIPEQADESEELAKYQPFRSHEPDGKYNSVSEEGSLAELTKYNAVRSHEPDGMYAVPYTDPIPDPAEVDHYSKPYMSHEPDGKYAVSHSEVVRDDAELAQYQPFLSHEPDGKYAAEMAKQGEQKDLDRYQDGFRSHEPNGKYAVEAEKLSEDADLGNHEAFNAEDLKAYTVPTEKTQIMKDSAELQTYKEVGHDEPVERNPADSWNKHPVLAHLLKRRPGSVMVAIKDTRPENAPTPKTEFRKMVEDLMARAATETDSLVTPSSSGDTSSQGSRSSGAKASPRRRLTGQYVQDFPEDFAVAWSTEPSETKSSLLPTNLDLSSVDKAAHRVETSDIRSSQAETGTKGDHAQPQIYKILAYDPVMQVIDTAETTSIVPDSSVPLTPAEAILRVSNPARFFPHFAPLQAQGFEIVSGSGDVLIFRKVRDVVQAPDEASKISGAAAFSTRDASVNPIDMTGGSDYNVAAGRFASPTGFVNYDLPPPGTFTKGDNPSSVKRGSRPFRLEDRDETLKLRQIVNTAMHEQGEQANQEKKEKGEKNKKTSVPKRLAVGAVSLAGILYSLGVAGDRLKQGRTEIKTPNPNKL